MAAQPKPLRFLFSKYAALAPNRTSHPEPQQELQPHGILRPLKLPGWSKAGSLSDLHLLGSDVSQSKLDRIHVFLTLSEVPGRSPPSVVDSSAGTSTTQDTASGGQSRERRRVAGGGRGSSSGSPTRFRSKSQEFENIYRLAASRCSPEFLKNGRIHLGSSAHQLASSYQSVHSPTGNNRAKTQLQISKHRNQKHNLSLNSKRPESANSNDLSIRGEEAAPTRGVMQVMIEERRNPVINGNGFQRPAEPLSYSYQDLNIMIGGNYPAKPRRQRDLSAKQNNRHIEANSDYSTVEREQRIPAGQLQRCPSLSTVDADRLDSSCYHYLLEGLTSDIGSSTLTSDDSDGAFSKVSALAQRPSTSGTEATAQRLRNLHTRTTYLSSPPSQIQSILPLGIQGMPGAPSSGAKSPELPWPPRYALNPPWITYKDLQTQNGPDFGFCNKRSRRVKDREKYRKTGETWDKGFDVSGQLKRKVHIVPSHVSTDCEQCNFYNTHSAKHKTQTQLECTSSPASNDTQTSQRNQTSNGHHKLILTNQHNEQKEENSDESPSKACLPPPTATTNSSLKVNIGIKESHSATPVQVRHGKALPSSKSFTKGTLLLGKSHKTPLYLDNVTNQHHNRHITSKDKPTRQDVPASSDNLNQESQQHKSRFNVAYSWDRASKVSFVNSSV